MRTFVVLMVLVIVLALALSASGFAAASFSISLTEKGLTPGEALLLGTVGSAFNLDTDVLLSYQSKTGTVEGAVSVAYTSSQSDVDSDVILRERSAGKSWDDIASRHHLPPGLAKKWSSHPGKSKHQGKGGRGRGPDPFEVGATISFLAEYYAEPEDQLVAWIESGLDVEDVALALNLSVIRSVRPSTVISLRLQGTSWSRIAGHYRVSMEELSKPSAKSKANGSKGSGKVKGHPKH